MSSNVRPESMERITTPELANKFIEEQVAAVREQVGGKRVLLALSGGVDSSVVAALLIRAIGKQLVCVHVNHGLMRKGESEQVIEVFRNQMDANLVYIDATDRFLDLLAGVSDPEKKRKIIGGEFIKDDKGEMVVSKLGEPLLEKIAQATDGAYIRSTNQSIGLDEIVRTINNMEKGDLAALRFEEFNEQFQYLIGAALVLLLLEFLLLDRRNPLLRRFNIFGTDTEK